MMNKTAKKPPSKGIAKLIDKLMEEHCDMEWAEGYSEPGYEDPPNGVLLADWNDIDRKLQTALEKAGYELEWCDEWARCDECAKFVRTSPTSYGWTRSYYQNGCDIICKNCVLRDEDATDAYVEWCRGNDKRAITFDGIDLAARGFAKLNEDAYENGWHHGQNDDPATLAKSLHEKGVDDFVFVIDDVGQFDMRFSCWVPAEQLNKARGASAQLPYDISEELGKALRGDSSSKFKVTTSVITPDQFVSGDHSGAPEHEGLPKDDDRKDGGIPFTSIGGIKGEQP